MSDYFPWWGLPTEFRMMIYDCLVPKGTVAAFVPGQGWVCRVPGGEEGPDRRAQGSNLADVRSLVHLSSTCSFLRAEVKSELFGWVVFHLEMGLQPVPGIPPGRHRLMMSSAWPLPPTAASDLLSIRKLVWKISQEDFAVLFMGMLASQQFSQALPSLRRLTVVRSADLLAQGPYVHEETLVRVIQTMMTNTNNRQPWQVGVPVVLTEDYMYFRPGHGRLDGAPTQAEYLQRAEAELVRSPPNGAVVEFEDL